MWSPPPPQPRARSTDHELFGHLFPCSRTGAQSDNQPAEDAQHFYYVLHTRPSRFCPRLCTDGMPACQSMITEKLGEPLPAKPILLQDRRLCLLSFFCSNDAELVTARGYRWRTTKSHLHDRTPHFTTPHNHPPTQLAEPNRSIDLGYRCQDPHCSRRAPVLQPLRLGGYALPRGSIHGIYLAVDWAIISVTAYFSFTPSHVPLNPLTVSLRAVGSDM